MEKRSESDSSEIMGDWEFSTPEVSEGITMVSVPTSPESERARSNPLETRVSTSIVAGEGKEEEAARRTLPPWIEPSYEWGSGKWREDGRKKKKKNKEKEEIEEMIPFKEIIESLLRNSGEKTEEEEDIEKGKKSQSVVDMLKSIGFKFP